MKIKFIIVLMYLLYGICFAQTSSPSLLETTTFITGKINTYGNSYASITESNNITNINSIWMQISFKGGNVKIEKLNQDNKEFIDTFYFNLKEFSPTVEINEHTFPNTSITYYNLDLRTYNNLNKVKYYNGLTGKEYFVSYVYITLWNKEIAERLKKSFEHAIKLCGGKREVF